MNEIEFSQAKTDQVFNYLATLVRSEIDKRVIVTVKEQDELGFYHAEIGISDKDRFSSVISLNEIPTLKESFSFENISELPALAKSKIENLFRRLFSGSPD
jgi:hypothetical protein